MGKDPLTRGHVFKLIAESSSYGNLGLFVGAGMSKAILNSDWDKVALSWKELIYKCALSFEIDLKEIGVEGASYPEISSKLAKEIAKKEGIDYDKGLAKLKQKIAEITCWYPTKEQRAEYCPILETLSPNWIITTNYDLILESLLTGKCISLSPSEQLISPKDLIPIYHLHGIRSNPDSIVISQEDYISLFRPNQYRQQKLSLSLKESTTLMIGYGLGDINVLTAVDWTNNVYSSQQITYPHGLIQLLHTSLPREKPYKDHNGIIIVEFSDLKQTLIDINNVVLEVLKSKNDENKTFESLNNYFKSPEEKEVIEIIENRELRNNIIVAVGDDGVRLISGFMELFTKIMDASWERTKPNGAFHAYAENLEILIDILVYISLDRLPPALLESIVYNLNRVAYYVGPNYGESNQAFRDWNARRSKIPKETLAEIKEIARLKAYSKLFRLISNH